jgi:hypothetical protein
MLAARARLGATFTTLHLVFEKGRGRTQVAAERPLLALLPIGYPMGRFGPVRRVPLADVVYDDRWGRAYRDL